MVDFRAVEMHEAVAGKEGPAYRMVRDPKSPSQEIGELFWQIMHCDGAEPFAVIDLQAAINDAAEAMGLHQDRVEHGLEITGRRIDDLQHFGGRGLSLERFALLGQ